MNEETHEEMVMRHKDQLMDIFNIYNNYLFDRSEKDTLNSTSNRSSLKKISPEASQRFINQNNSE
jgi:hypothetical protein